VTEGLHRAVLLVRELTRSRRLSAGSSLCHRPLGPHGIRPAVRTISVSFNCRISGPNASPLMNFARLSAALLWLQRHTRLQTLKFDAPDGDGTRFYIVLR
jgi:hypothetical protein